MKNIKYFCHYDVPENALYNRHFALSAGQKIEYITKKLNLIGYSVDIVSLSSTRNSVKCKASTTIINSNTNIRFFPSLKWGNKIQRTLSRLFMSYNIFIYILFHLRRNEKVILYHTIEHAGLLYKMFRLKKIDLVLQLEEVYQDVIKLNRHNVTIENKLIDFAKSYIISNESMRIITDKKPAIVLNGNYEPLFEQGKKVREDNCIHLVYAGTFMKQKGIERVLKAAIHLPSNYILHIYGFGTVEETTNVTKMIDTINKERSCLVIFEGSKSGETFINEISTYHIGLSLQDEVSDFNDTSFPSKILTYFRVGLNVVSTNVSSIRDSVISDIICFSSSDQPEEIANYISVLKPIEKSKIYEKLKSLDLQFNINLERLIKNEKEQINEK